MQNVQVRSAGGNRIEGYSAVFNSLSEDLGGFHEILKPGCFARAIRTGQDIRCLFNHDPRNILGRTKSGTLKLAEDSAGLHFDCAMGKSPLDRDVYEAIERGDVDGCSFAFLVANGGESWADMAIGPVRTVSDVDLFDVGPVTTPAYSATSVAARNLWPEGMPVEVRSHHSSESGPVAVCYRFQPVDQRLEDMRRVARLRLALLED